MQRSLAVIDRRADEEAGRTNVVGESLKVARKVLASRELDDQGVAGNIYAIGIGAPRNDYAERSQPAATDLESQAGILLSQVARSYKNTWTAGEEQLAQLLGLALIRPVASEVMVSNDLAVQSEFGVPTKIEWRGVRVDADIRAARVLPIRAGSSTTATSDL